MEKKFFWATAIVVTIITFSSCDNKKNDVSDIDNPVIDRELTPEETKEKLRKVADKMIGKFNTADQQSAIELADGFYEKYEDYDWDDFDDYYDHERYNDIFRMPRYVTQVAQGKRAPSALNRSYTFSFAGESVIWEADEKYRVWRNKGKASDNSVIFRFTDKQGVQCEAKAWGEGETEVYEYSWTEEEGNWYNGYYNVNKTATIKVPKKVFCTLTQGKTEIIRVEFKQEFVKNDHANFSLEAKLVNLRWISDVKINSTNASAAFAFYYDNDRLFSGAVNLPAYELLNNTINSKWDENGTLVDQYDEEYEDVLKKIGAANGIVDLMGEVQIKVDIENFGNAYSDYTKWDEKYSSSTKKGADRLCYIINENQTNGLYYNSDKKQAEVRAQTAIDNDYYYDEEYYVEGVLYFPQDGTTYAFEEYFDSKPFTDLQYTIEDLVNKYIHLSDCFYDEVGEVEF